MTDGLDQAIVDSALSLLRADMDLTVVDGPVQNPTPAMPYVVVWATVSWPFGDAVFDGLDGVAKRANAEWFIHGVAANNVSWRAAMQRVRTQLLNVRPTIPGVQAGLIRMDEGSTPPSVNEVLGTPVVTGYHIYRLTCTV